MSGVLTLAKAKTLFNFEGVSDALIQFRLCAAQVICETITGLAFGAEVTSQSNSGSVYTLTIAGMAVQPGDYVWLIGGPSEAVEVDAVGDGTIQVELSGSPTITKVLPVVKRYGGNSSGYVYLNPRPVYRILSVKTRPSSEVAWSDTDNVTTIESQYYSPFQAFGNLSAGVYVAVEKMPRRADGGRDLIKSVSYVSPEDMQIEYVAGFVGQIPADLMGAIGQLALLIGKDEGGVFASESLDYYSYSQLTPEQMASVPHSMQATFKRYSRKGY